MFKGYGLKHGLLAQKIVHSEKINYSKVTGHDEDLTPHP
jgi:hypothetical protein